MCPSKCEVRKLSASIRTSAVVVVRLLLYNRTTHYHFERGRSAETISAPTSVSLCTHCLVAHSAASARLNRMTEKVLENYSIEEFESLTGKTRESEQQ